MDALSPEIHRVMMLSTRYLPDRFATAFELTEIAGITAYEIIDADNDPVGWLMHVPDDPIDPDDCDDDATEILDVQTAARAEGCQFVRFDRDGPICSTLDLPTWEW